MTKVLNMAFLGTTALHLDEEPVSVVSAKAQALLCYVAVSGRVHSRQALAGLLWGDLPEADARRNLRGVALKLRHHFERHLLITHQTIAFDKTSPYQLDVMDFQALCQRDDVVSLVAAAALYRGDFLEDLQVRQAPAFEEWVIQQREALHRQVVGVCRRLVLAFEGQRQYEAAIDYARRLLLLDPANEEGHRLLMRLLAKQGQRSAALRQYDACVAALAEMGVAPTEETAVLLQQIRANNLATQPRPRPVAVTPAAPPFLAGPPITQPTSFFGRQREIKRIFNLLRYTPLQNAAIIGPRRSGKTSLLHYLKNKAATEQPQLAQHRWIFIDFQDARLGVRSQLLHSLLEQMQLTVPEPCDLESFMDIVADNLQRQTVILMDEIGVALQRYPELDEPFWESLRSLATNQVGGKLAFVLAGAESPSQLAQQSGMGSPFFNIFGYVATLGPLTEEEAHNLINSSPRPFPAADVDWILQESGRWPILLQILCRERLLTLDEGLTDEQWRQEARQQMSPFLYLKDG